MQMYKGLPVITNQITTQEQRGVPHHLLATIAMQEPTWTVSVFAREATKLIREIRSRGKLPIVVGGTHYYISALLFDNSLVDGPDAGAPEPSVPHLPQAEIHKQHPILDGPTDAMLKKLQEVDPAMGSRWHPDDRRKIKRSLEIFLTTGRKASDIYAGQQAAKAVAPPADSPWEALMFWVYSKPAVLNERLDKRVDKMEGMGLMDEVKQLHRYLRDQAAAGEDVDRTRGIWQTIGFKQFEPFLDADMDGATAPELEKLRRKGLEDMKVATRQYAKSQLRWIRLKTGHALQERGAMGDFYLLDSSDAALFSENVLAPASQITQAFLGGQQRQQPTELSETAQEVLTALSDDISKPKPKFQARHCDVCDMTLTTENEWTKHVAGRHHRRALRHKSRTALVPVEHAGPKPPAAAKEPKGFEEIDLTGFP